MKNININQCYLVLISEYIGFESLPNNMISIKSTKLKFTIVKYKEVGKYKDIISNECYDLGTTIIDRPGTLFINDKYFMLPLNSLINVENSHISKKKLLQIVKEPLIELTRILHTNQRGKIMHVETLQNEFSKVNIKKKVK